MFMYVLWPQWDVWIHWNKNACIGLRGLHRHHIWKHRSKDTQNVSWFFKEDARKLKTFFHSQLGHCLLLMLAGIPESDDWGDGWSVEGKARQIEAAWCLGEQELSVQQLLREIPVYHPKITQAAHHRFHFVQPPATGWDTSNIRTFRGVYVPFVWMLRKSITPNLSHLVLLNHTWGNNEHRVYLINICWYFLSNCFQWDLKYIPWSKRNT